jgi:hypothetical protein
VRLSLTHEKLPSYDQIRRLDDDIEVIRAITYRIARSRVSVVACRIHDFNVAPRVFLLCTLLPLRAGLLSMDKEGRIKIELLQTWKPT